MRHVAGEQALSRAEYGLKLLDWWGIAAGDRLEVGPSEGLWPRDCRLEIGLAKDLLDIAFPGVDRVLGSHQKVERGLGRRSGRHFHRGRL